MHNSVNYISLLNLHLEKARMFLEVLVLISAMVYIFLAMKEVYHQGFQIFFSTLVSVMSVFCDA